MDSNEWFLFVDFIDAFMVLATVFNCVILMHSCAAEVYLVSFTVVVVKPRIIIIIITCVALSSFLII